MALSDTPEACALGKADVLCPMDAVPFFIYSSEKEQSGCATFDEFSTADMNYYIPDGYTLMDILTEK